MSKIEKLLLKAEDNPQNMRFGEICKLAEHFGFHYRGIPEILTLQDVGGMAKS